MVFAPCLIPPRLSLPRDGLRTELKLIREDVHRITLELKERILKVEKLQNKYECISSKSRGVDDGEEPKSQAYYVIKAAQVGGRGIKGRGPKSQAYYVITAAQVGSGGEERRTGGGGP